MRAVPVPEIGARDVLVKVKAASICGTDLHIQDWDRWAQGRIHPPLVFGHEFCGEVVERGSAATAVAVGAFVSVEGHLADGTCYQCRTGNAHICENVRIVDWNGVEYPIDRWPVALCRCGASSRKPFCDGTHKRIGVQASETTAVAPADAEDTPSS